MICKCAIEEQILSVIKYMNREERMTENSRIGVIKKIEIKNYFRNVDARINIKAE